MDKLLAMFSDAWFQFWQIKKEKWLCLYCPQETRSDFLAYYISHFHACMYSQSGSCIAKFLQLTALRQYVKRISTQESKQRIGNGFLPSFVSINQKKHIHGKGYSE